jgi:aryl-alcohol dehydrogenase-like predicted oxidoreductase
MAGGVRRQLGRTGFSVHPLCLGGNVFGWTADESASFEVLDEFVARGGNFIDTAESYSRWIPGNSGGESEAMIGRWLAARAGMRERVLIMTKVGPPLGRERIVSSCEASLERLGIDTIDVLLAHNFDPETPLSETLDAFDSLVRAGKVRFVGSSNHSDEQLKLALEASKAYGWSRYDVLQPPYSLLNRSYEGPLAQLCAEAEIGVVGYAALAGGFLTGKYRRDGPLPLTPRAGGVQQRWMNERGWRVLEAVEAVASELGATPAQVALAWVMAKPPPMVGPIASATSAEQVRELMDAASLKLSEQQMARLDEASAPD